MAALELLRRATTRHLKSPAVVHKGSSLTYETLLQASHNLSEQLRKQLPSQHSPSASTPPRIGLYAAPGPEYVLGTLAIWQAGGITVPLATSHPPAELDYVFQDAGLSMALTTEAAHGKLADIATSNKAGLHLIEPPHLEPAVLAPAAGLGPGTAAGSGATAVPPAQERGQEREPWLSALRCHDRPEGDGALIIYTSGTTGKPKGVLHTHRSLLAQASTLCSAWEWGPSDAILHALPLHHIHGIVNALYCPLHVGGRVEFMDKFSPQAVWARLMDGDTTVFMGVPTMYALLLAVYDKMSPAKQAAAAAAASRLRLTVSGSSACPVPIMERWRALSGQTLLERYGMTEIGMALSNPYKGAQRRPGSVGQPLPGVDARIAESGELLIRGPMIFKEYWGKAEATAKAFDADGFFLTGDTASVEWVAPVDSSSSNMAGGHGQAAPSSSSSGAQAGAAPGQQLLPYYSILGRTSVDIIKTGGFKVSALEVEGVLLEHPDLAEVAVLGAPDEVYGQVVAALVVPKHHDGEPGAVHGTAQAAEALQQALRAHCADRLAPYQAPKRYLVIDKLPRNAMGKVNKKELLKTFFPQQAA